MSQVHAGPRCYRPARCHIDSAGLLSVEECAALHNSRFVAFTFILPAIFIRIIRR